MPESLKTELAKIIWQPQRQDSTNAQLIDLHAFAVRLGMYDAADLIKQIAAKASKTPSGASKQEMKGRA